MSISVDDAVPSPGTTSDTATPVVETRVLVGHLNPDEAIRVTLGRDPGPFDDVSKLTAEIEARRAKTATRQHPEITDAIDSGDRTRLDAVAARAEVQAAFHGVSWSVQWVNMQQVISVQKEIITAGLDDRVQAAACDEAELVELCLPSRPHQEQLGCSPDPDGRGFTLVSANPNLRAATMIDAATQRVIVQFGISPGYVNVARYRGRYYLRDGYHRVAGLMRQGTTMMPAVVIEAPSFSVVAPNPGLFPEEITVSDAPPMVRDFWDDAIALTSSRPVQRVGLHVRANEIRIPA